MARSDYEHLSREQLIDTLVQRDETIARLEARVAHLEAHNAKLEAHVARLEAHIATLDAHIVKLQNLLDQATRGGKRQAAPFSKGAPKSDPKTPGRKPGDAHGRHGHRKPPLSEPHETIDVPLPKVCPDCGGPLDECEVAHQHQIELPRQPLHRRFDLHIGRCRCCGRRVQPRHPLQTSDALGAAGVHLGAHAQAFVAMMKNKFGLSYGDIQGILHDWFGMSFTRGAGARLVQRVARKVEPVYDQLKSLVRRSDMVCPDETGWKLAGLLVWMHVFVARQATVYLIRPSRGGDVPEELLGRDYAGMMTHDGWTPYDGFTSATHQQCLRHLLNRCKELLEQARGRARLFPERLARLLRQSLGLRDRRDAARVSPLTSAMNVSHCDAMSEVTQPARITPISPHGLAIARGRLEHRLDRLVGRRFAHAGNRRLAKFLAKHPAQVLAFLHHPDLEATNWMAEQAIRPAVVNRKVFGGNRTQAGAHALEVQASLFVTCQQHAVDACRYLANLLRQPASTFGSPPFIPLPFVTY